MFGTGQTKWIQVSLIIFNACFDKIAYKSIHGSLFEQQKFSFRKTDANEPWLNC